MDKVSVIVPVYNVEKYVERCLRSVLNQTYKNFEIICVDDCGTDHSIQIIEQIQKEFPQKIKIIYGEINKGLGAARDKGLSTADGEYVSFVDSDDYLKTDFLETYISVMKEKNADIVVGGYIRDVEGKFSETKIDTKDLSYTWMNVSACTKIYRRKFLEDNHLSFLGVRRYEDEGFMYRSLVCAPRVELINYSGYYYYMNSESITRNLNKDRTKIVEEYLQTVRKINMTVQCQGDTKELLNYCLVSGLTANLIYNSMGCGKKRMNILYSKYDALIKEIDKNICKNKYIALKFLKSEPWKKRYATWLILRLRKIKLDRAVFFLISII